MKERPILFSGSMVRALLSGTQTQTRRLVVPQPQRGTPTFGPLYMGPDVEKDPTPFLVWQDDPQSYFKVRCPYGVPGDRLWVRETFRMGYGSGMAHYRADEDECAGGPWTPSIYMPRWASRISLEVTSVRVERLQEISADDVVDEGIDPSTVPGIGSDASFVAAFERLWDSINGKRAPWDSNPWVWVVGFEREEEKA